MIDPLCIILLDLGPIPVPYWQFWITFSSIEFAMILNWFSTDVPDAELKHSIYNRRILKSNRLANALSLYIVEFALQYRWSMLTYYFDILMASICVFIYCLYRCLIYWSPKWLPKARLAAKYSTHPTNTENMNYVFKVLRSWGRPYGPRLPKTTPDQFVIDLGQTWYRIWKELDRCCLIWDAFSNIFYIISHHRPTDSRPSVERPHPWVKRPLFP